MTPAARMAAAIAVLDHWLGGVRADKALSDWGRRSRYAGSSDRAAVRDIVFGCIRCRRSFAALGGAESGRGLVIGAVRSAGEAIETYFDGGRFAPNPLTQAERDTLSSPTTMRKGERLDFPDWLLPEAERSLEERTDAELQALRERAPLFLRANLIRTDRSGAIEALASDEIEAQAEAGFPTALRVTENSRRLRQSKAFRDGLVELQDLSSQAVIDTFASLVPGATVLDYCAGGGGKTLAMAAYGPGGLVAHDVAPIRMTDLPARLQRSGAKAEILRPEALSGGQRFDIVLADAPCTGSGAWRRDPEGKWALTRPRFDELRKAQMEALQSAAKLTADDGLLVYATCSLFRSENEDAVAAFLDRNNGWSARRTDRFLPSSGGDGFFVAHLERAG